MSPTGDCASSLVGQLGVADAKRDTFNTDIAKLFVVTNNPNDGVKKSEAWRVMRHYQAVERETIRAPSDDKTSSRSS